MSHIIFGLGKALTWSSQVPYGFRLFLRRGDELGGACEGGNYSNIPTVYHPEYITVNQYFRMYAVEEPRYFKIWLNPLGQGWTSISIRIKLQTKSTPNRLLSSTLRHTFLNIVLSMSVRNEIDDLLCSFACRLVEREHVRIEPMHRTSEVRIVQIDNSFLRCPGYGSYSLRSRFVNPSYIYNRDGTQLTMLLSALLATER